MTSSVLLFVSETASGGFHWKIEASSADMSFRLVGSTPTEDNADAILQSTVRAALDNDAILDIDGLPRMNATLPILSGGPVSRLDDRQLGMATTGAMLREIGARMEVTQNSIAGRDLGRLCKEALAHLCPICTRLPHDRRPGMTCAHEDFCAVVTADRITDTESGPVVGFYAALTVECASCGMPMVFRGAPVGLGQHGPHMSPDGTEMRLPMIPQDADPHFGLGLAGFAARIREVVPEGRN